MRIFKWGKSLAVELPADVVDMLNLKEDDEVEICAVGADTVSVAKGLAYEQSRAIERIRAMAKPLPADWTFDRNDANQR